MKQVIFDEENSKLVKKYKITIYFKHNLQNLINKYKLKISYKLITIFK